MPSISEHTHTHTLRTILLLPTSNNWNTHVHDQPKFHSPPSMTIFFFFFFFFFLLVPCTAQLSFSFTSFDPNNPEIKYDPEASPVGSVIELTYIRDEEIMPRSTGRATYFEPMQLWDKASDALADFHTHFSFVIHSQNQTPYGDGMAFFLAAVGFPIPKFQEGMGLGLLSREQTITQSSSSSYPFVAVEFDTFHNTWDPLGEHVGINFNSIKSVDTKEWKGRIPDGKLNEAWISYNSSTTNLSVAFTSFPNESTSILQELSQIVDLRKLLPEWVTFGFSAATGSYAEKHTLHSWNFSSNIQIPPNRKRTNKKTRILVGSIVGVCVLISGLGLLWFSFKKRKKNRGENTINHDFNALYEFEGETGPKKFSYKELAIATRNFAEEEKLGQGGFGSVYRGFLTSSYVAVKRVSKESKQGIKEFASEVKIINRLRHRNLVELLGWCHEERELLLVYEFMPNGSLDSHLFKDNTFLTWQTRYNIAKGLAAALLYLHEGGEQCVLHRDIKSSNIMLDSNFNAKLGDFGLARLVDHGKEPQTTNMAGTMGYMAPEYLMTSRVSKESDVYSFGVVALEIACGRKSIDLMANKGQINLVEWVWKLYERGNFLEAADAKLGDFNVEQMECLLMVGLWCVQPNYNLRPSIKQAVQVLDLEAPLPSLAPNMPVPTYLAPERLGIQSSSSSENPTFIR